MSSQKQMVSYTNEDALMEAIKSLPDDMILEIKAYVISPYKYMAELKLYKYPTFVIHHGEVRRKVFREVRLNGEPIIIPKYLQYEVYYNGYNDINVHNLQANWEGGTGGGWDRRLKYHTLIMDRAVINQMDEVKYNYQYQNKKILQNLQIKGRTKLIKEPKMDIITAIMKGS